MNPLQFSFALIWGQGLMYSERHCIDLLPIFQIECVLPTTWSHCFPVNIVWVSDLSLSQQALSWSTRHPHYYAKQWPVLCVKPRLLHCRLCSMGILWAVLWGCLGAVHAKLDEDGSTEAEEIREWRCHVLSPGSVWRPNREGMQSWNVKVCYKERV